MSTFVLAPIWEIRGIIRVHKLFIDGHCPFDEFCDQIRREGNLVGQLASMANLLEQVANLKRLPREKFRDITPERERYKEYELKRNDLRVYLFKEEGLIVVLGGKKGNQKGDIRRFRRIKQLYLDSKQHHT